MAQTYDVIVIGAGPAGYICAIRAAQLGQKVACVEEWTNPAGESALGGTCLNVGCIPSKALLQSSENYEHALHGLGEHGIAVTGAKMDVAKMIARKDAIVSKMTKGIEFLFKKNKITWLKGHGRFVGKGEGGWQIEVAGAGRAETVEGRTIVIATGSRARHLPNAPVDNKLVCDNVGALDFDSVPERLGVIGAGVIGLELGSVWRRLGAEVVVLEALEQFLAMADQQLAKEALRHFKKQGLDIRLGSKVSGLERGKDGLTLRYDDAKGAQSVTVDKVIVAIGRRPYSEGLLGEGTGVQVDERGFVKVDHECRTGAGNVWAVGDLVRGPMLAHKGKEEGVMVGDLIAGLVSEVNYKAIPSVIYTAPEIAWVGQTEEEVKASGRAYKTGSFPFVASGRARAMEATAGFCKVISATDDDEILGVHIVGPMAGELIAEAVLALEYSASTEDLQRTMHAHPTLSEALHEAALAADKRAIDMPNR